MPNGGHEYVDWESFREHEGESRDGFNRLSVLETQVDNNTKEIDEMKSSIKELEKTVWKASGVAIAVLILVDLFLKAYHG